MSAFPLIMLKVYGKYKCVLGITEIGEHSTKEQYIQVSEGNFSTYIQDCSSIFVMYAGFIETCIYKSI